MREDKELEKCTSCNDNRNEYYSTKLPFEKSARHTEHRDEKDFLVENQ